MAAVVVVGVLMDIAEDGAIKFIQSRYYETQETKWAIGVAQKVTSRKGNFTLGQLRAALNLLVVERSRLKRWIETGHKDWAYNRVQRSGFSVREIEVGILALMRRMIVLRHVSVDHEQRQANISEESKSADYRDLMKAAARSTSKFK